MLFISQAVNSVIEREMGCKENFNYSNFIFNHGEKKKDHNSFI